MSNWKIEYKVDYHISTVVDGIKGVEYNSLIIEGSSVSQVKNVVDVQFINVVGFKIDRVTKIWEY